MHSIYINGHSIRCFHFRETAYLFTSDLNIALGFAGDNTAFDKLSTQVRKLFICEVAISDGTIGEIKLDREFFIETFGNESIDNRSLVIELKHMVKAILRSNKSELKDMQDRLCGAITESFFQKSSTLPQLSSTQSPL